MADRILYVSSTRHSWFENQDAEEHFRAAPYSIDAIGYNLAEMAVSLSGDDIKTITKYYADPAQPNLGAVRVVDLI